MTQFFTCFPLVYLWGGFILTDHCAILSPFTSVALSEVVREKWNQPHVWSLHLPLNSEARSAVIQPSHCWRKLSCPSNKSQEDYLLEQEFFSDTEQYSHWSWSAWLLSNQNHKLWPGDLGIRDIKDGLVFRGRFFTWLSAPKNILVIKIFLFVRNWY